MVTRKAVYRCTPKARRYWREKRRDQELELREEGRCRVAAWITTKARVRLAILCKAHGTTIAEEIEALILR